MTLHSSRHSSSHSNDKFSVRAMYTTLGMTALISIIWTSYHSTHRVQVSRPSVCDYNTCAPVCADHVKSTPVQSSFIHSTPLHTCPKCSTCPKCPACPKMPRQSAKKPPAENVDDRELHEQMLDTARQLRKIQAKTPPELATALEAYRERHLAAIEDKAAGEEARYIIYAAGPNDGYGNRLPGVVTAFVWALLTERVLLVEWRDDKELMPHPAPFGTLFENGLEFDIDNLNVSGLKAKRAINGREIWQEMSTVDLDVAFPERILRFNSDDWLFPLLAANPVYAARVAELFPHSRAFHHVGAWLLAPAPALQEKVDAFHQEVFRGQFVVGLHLRLQKVMPDDQGRKKIAPPPPATFFQTARLLQQARGMADDSTVFYVATETADAVAAARDWFSSRNLRVVFLDDMYNIKRKNHRDAERGSVEALHNAIIELKLLSTTDEMVGTFASSYSYVSSAWGNIIPYYVMPDGGYWHAGVSEPCFRFASRGHAEHMEDYPLLDYHQTCAVTRHAGGVAMAERGKDGKLKEAKQPKHKEKHHE